MILTFFLSSYYNTSSLRPSISISLEGTPCRSGETGRRAGLKIQWTLRPCRFDSDLRHQIKSISYMRPLKNVQFWSRSRKARISTTGIYRIFRGLKFEPNAEIGQKGRFFKGLNFSQPLTTPHFLRSAHKDL